MKRKRFGHYRMGIEDAPIFAKGRLLALDSFRKYLECRSRDFRRLGLFEALSENFLRLDGALQECEKVLWRMAGGELDESQMEDYLRDEVCLIWDWVGDMPNVCSRVCADVDDVALSFSDDADELMHRVWAEVLNYFEKLHDALQGVEGFGDLIAAPWLNGPSIR